MAPRRHLLLRLAAAVVLIPAATTADPDAVQDYCVPDTGGRGRAVELPLLPSYPCRSPANLTASDFAFAGVRAAGNFSSDTGFAGVSVTPAQFPALHTLGVSFARADLSAAGGVNPPHYHPRATETALVLAGRVYAGFVDSGGRLFAKVLARETGGHGLPARHGALPVERRRRARHGLRDLQQREPRHRAHPGHRLRLRDQGRRPREGVWPLTGGAPPAGEEVQPAQEDQDGGGDGRLAIS
ncbi:hypothetical protein PVAP13_3KG410900 [Panicum virgatum]|uniref:Cupin type-1 domain-containing protein n=1 Tax=Panicum virgatum TaxID=38727 RepID=A0A8T0V4H8_PANVG|nr:hypothetical protein PVAP13_3KG410900 [Panicum virgatum]